MLYTANQTSTFTQWLYRQTYREDPVGDLAKDAKFDKKWPSRGKAFSTFEDHLHRMIACDRALYALVRAWFEWSGENPKLQAEAGE